MLGLILIYFIGKSYYKIAEEFAKNKWLWAILGIAFYYTGIIVGGIILAIGYELVLEKSIESANEVVIGIMALPFGLLTWWASYSLLKKQWSSRTEMDEQLLDAE